MVFKYRVKVLVVLQQLTHEMICFLTNTFSGATGSVISKATLMYEEGNKRHWLIEK